MNRTSKSRQYDDEQHMASALRDDARWLHRLAATLRRRHATDAELIELVGLARDLPLAATVLERRSTS